MDGRIHFTYHDSLAPRILIVEDDPDQAASLAGLLNSEGYPTRTAASATEAASALSRAAYPLCIVDWMLPDLPGHRLINRIKFIQPSARCILLTGLPRPDTAEQAVNYGADGYAVKPVDPPFLFALIDSVLLLRRLHQENERLEGAIQTLRAFRHEICLPLENLLADLESFYRRNPNDPALSRNVAQIRLTGEMLLKTLDRLDGLDVFHSRSTPTGPMLDLRPNPGPQFPEDIPF